MSKKRNLTQAQVAENLSVSFQAVSLWERGETYPEIDKLVDIAVCSYGKKHDVDIALFRIVQNLAGSFPIRQAFIAVKR